MPYNIGDKVRIVNYGALMWGVEDGKPFFYDWQPQLVGKEATIKKVFKGEYGLNVKGEGYISWFSKKQLKLIAKKQNKL